MGQAATELEQTKNALIQQVRQWLTTEETRLSTMVSRLPVVFGSVRSRSEQQIMQCSHAIQMAVRMRLQQDQMELDALHKNLSQYVSRLMEREKNNLDAWQRQIETLDPERLLKLGYSLTYCRGKVVLSATELKPGDVIETRLRDGNVTSKILEP